MVLDINEIQKILPHRPPMLLVDRIIEVQDRTSDAILRNSENIANLVKADSELTALLLSQQTRSVYSPADVPGRKLEGYQ